MIIERRIAHLSGPTNESWEKHSNSWSVCGRFSCPALLMLTAWSRVWLNWWALAVGTVVVIWIALNPFLFAKSSNSNSYAARSAFGERVWLYRDKLNLPSKRLALPPLLTLINALGFAAAVYGVVALSFPPRTGPLHLPREGIGHGEEATFRRRRAEAAT
ncbi:DUF6653 family protein [Aestuariibius sp. 2305UL40-4]|uniref:DUF6653 family protein n=1 Tax=Aestuariibius violaceus TaxID=3234132 RepID=UPI00345E4A5F